MFTMQLMDTFGKTIFILIAIIAFQITLIRALEWLDIEKVSWSVLENFPKKEIISLDPIDALKD